MNDPRMPSGWYPDPDGPGRQRWWDGTGWTRETRSASTAGTLAPMTPDSDALRSDAPELIEPGPEPEARRQRVPWWLVAVVALLVVAAGVALGLGFAA